MNAHLLKIDFSPKNREEATEWLAMRIPPGSVLYSQRVQDGREGRYHLYFVLNGQLKEITRLVGEALTVEVWMGTIIAGNQAESQLLEKLSFAIHGVESMGTGKAADLEGTALVPDPFNYRAGKSLMLVTL